VERLLVVSGRPARPVELTIVVQSHVRPWRYPPRRELQYGEWLRDELERGDLEPVRPATDPDLATLITMVLLGDRPLVGPPPADLLDPVPHDDYVRAVADGMEGLLAGLESDRDTRNVVLTLARMWCTLATREIRSKDSAADWTLARLPEEHRAVLRRARSVYLGEEDERWADLAGGIRPYGDYLAAEIGRLVSGTRGR
jgi:streptomycin 3"-adenylyltransferase